MPAPDAARRHYLTQKALTAAVVKRMRIVWHRIDAGALDASWNAVLPQAVALLTNGQLLAASRADNYLNAVLAEQGIDPARAASVSAAGFAGTASDGRALQSLLVGPVITTKVAIAARHSTADALAAGEASFVRMVATQIQDAGRIAVSTGIVARPAVTHYTRVLRAPSCARCVILAGKVYKYNAGFARHPHCDCEHLPSTEDIGSDFITDPNAYFRSLSPADQDRYFTKAGAETIRQGGDMGQVVNARRGMYQANGQTLTREGTTRRGFAGKRIEAAGSSVEKLPGARLRSTTRARLMPESIMQQAGDDRSLAIDLLRENGFLV